MKYFFIFIICITAIMSAFQYDNYADAINFVGDKLASVTTSLSMIGDSDNVENFRQHPLLNYKFTSIGMYNTGNNIVPIGMFIAKNILPSYLTNGNYNHLFTTQILVSQYSYSFSYKYLDNPIKPSGFVSKSYSFENSMRVKVIVYYGDNKYTHDILITYESLNGQSVPTFFVVTDDKVYISNRFNDFYEFYESLISENPSNLLNLNHIINQDEYSYNYNIYGSKETKTLIIDIFAPFYDYYTRFNTNK